LKTLATQSNLLIKARLALWLDQVAQGLAQSSFFYLDICKITEELLNPMFLIPYITLMTKDGKGI